MNFRLLASVFVVFFALQGAQGQTGVLVPKDQQIIFPISIDKNYFSGIDLARVTNSNDPDRVLFQRQIYYGPELGVFIVSSETASADWDDYSLEEFIYVINGRAKLIPKGQDERYFNTGDSFIAPRGYTGFWETQGGEQYYYELSVIATNRPELADKSKSTLPVLIDKRKMSGIGLTLIDTTNGTRYYRDFVHEGSELRVTLDAETPRNFILDGSQNETLIYVIAGNVKLEPTGGNSLTYQTGDFFILPRGFIGSWTSNGHDLFRTMRVTAINREKIE